MVRKLIRTAALVAAVAGTLATVAAAAPAAGGTSTSEPVAQVSIQDVRVPVPGQKPVPAYLVRSAGTLQPGSQAGVLFLHWLGQIHSDRTEFLAEAVQLAPRGAVSPPAPGGLPLEGGAQRETAGRDGHQAAARRLPGLPQLAHRQELRQHVTDRRRGATGSSSTGWGSPAAARHGTRHCSPASSRYATSHGWAATSCSSGRARTSS